MSGSVWVKVHPDDAGGGGLEGLGDWAEITAMTGDPKRYDYTDDGLEWTAFEWSTDGSFSISGGEIVETALVAGGGAGGRYTGPTGGGGGAGGVVQAVAYVKGQPVVPVIIGKGGTQAKFDGSSPQKPASGVDGTDTYIGSPIILTAVGGGGGGGGNGDAGIRGGSGGSKLGGGATAGTGVAGQGHEGSDTSAGGGGGASGPGVDSTGGPGITKLLNIEVLGGTEFAIGGGGNTGTNTVDGYGNGGRGTTSAWNSYSDGAKGRDGVAIVRVPASKVTATGGWV